MSDVGLDLGYIRAGAGADDISRQMEAVRAAGVAEKRVFVDRTTGPADGRQGITALISLARPGDRVTILTLDRLGCSMRETLSLVHDFTTRGVFLRTLDDGLGLDTSMPGPGTDMALALLARLAQMERTYRPEHAAAARAAKRARGPMSDRTGRPGAPARPKGSPKIQVGALPPRLL